MLEESGFGSEAAAPVAKHLYELLDGQPQTPYIFVPPAQGRLMLPRSVSRHDSRRSRRDPTAPLRHLDPVLLVCSLALGLIGVVSVYSATRGPGPDFVDSYLVRQFAFVVIGTGVMGVFALVDYHKLHDWAWLFYGATTALLVLVVSPLGSQSKGAQAWFALGPFQLQPAEFAKLSLIGALAFLLSEFKGDIDLRRLGALLVCALVPMALIMLQPDLGLVLILGVITLALLVVGRRAGQVPGRAGGGRAWWAWSGC